eukprot:4160543-Prymnesium_polylepis.1
MRHTAALRLSTHVVLRPLLPIRAHGRKQLSILIEACISQRTSEITGFGRKPGNTLIRAWGEFPRTKSAPIFMAREAREPFSLWGLRAGTRGPRGACPRHCPNRLAGLPLPHLCYHSPLSDNVVAPST